MIFFDESELINHSKYISKYVYMSRSKWGWYLYFNNSEKCMGRETQQRQKKDLFFINTNLNQHLFQRLSDRYLYKLIH